MNVAIVTASERPPGMAHAQRLHLLAKSLMQAGCTITVRNLSACPGGTSVPGAAHVKDLYDGVEYEYYHRKIPIAGHLGRRFEYGLNMVDSARRISSRAPRVDVVVLDMLFLPAMVLFGWASRRTGAVYVMERTEYPFLDKGMTPIRRLLTRLTARLGLGLFDGMLLISRPLERVFGSFVNRHARTMVVPIICDPTEFQLQAYQPRPADMSECIGYAGSLTEQKDGFFTLIRAFATLAGQRTRSRLIVLGAPELASNGEGARRLVRELGLEERVEFKGFVPRQEYVRVLSSAGLLVLAKPDNVQNDYNMPTKVADYLLSGRPALLTKCGVIADELRDGENVFFAQPGSPEDFAEKMLWILNHTADANRVGLAGRAYALRHYDYRVHGSRIVAFLRQLRDLKARRSPLAWQSTDGS